MENLEGKTITKQYTAKDLIAIDKIKYAIGILNKVRRDIVNNDIDKDATGIEITKLYIDHEVMQLQRDLLDISSTVE